MPLSMRLPRCSCRKVFATPRVPLDVYRPDGYILAGWIWDPESKWDVELNLTDVDAEGFSYSVDFQHFVGDNTPDAPMTCGGCATKTMMHFVRRRRLARNQCFDGKNILHLHGLPSWLPSKYVSNAVCCVWYVRVCLSLCLSSVSLVTDTTGFTCDYCDLQEVETLTKMFLDKLTAASINRHPRNISERKINALKNEMMDVLQLSFTSSAATTNKTAPATTTPSPSMTPYFSTKTSDILDSFITSCRTTLAMASSVFKSGDASDNFTQRQQDVARYFAMEERVEWAKLVLRKHDVEYNFHCSVRNCGPSCIFAVESCPNVGCCVYFSRKWAEAHDAICPEKILGCPRTCGVCLQRKRMDMHLRDDCILRPITCTYHSVGCKHGKWVYPPPALPDS